MTYGYAFYWNNIVSVLTHKNFEGWGRKRTGRFASWCHHRTFGGKLTLYEDGFIRSLGLGVEGSPSFSVVADDIGIYYDATRPSKLENILNTYDFALDAELMMKAREAIALIKKNYISKYNNAPEVDESFRSRFGMTEEKVQNEKILVIAQTSEDMSLKYGLAETFSTDEMIQAAVAENPNAAIYLKLHPDVLNGKKKSDIDTEKAKQHCIIIDENVNPISLLKYFSKVYTKTSQMGFEALLLGKECVCFGMPFYAGWGVTDDRITCERRKVERSIEEIFAAGYILYSHYYNPYKKRESDIFDTIETIIKYRDNMEMTPKELFFFGFSHWKRRHIMHFFPNSKIHYCANLKQAKEKGLNSDSVIYIWGKKPFAEVEKYIINQHMRLQRVEDGFIRSVSLGSDLTKAYSLVVDTQGIYFDPTHKSDLEDILNTYVFDEQLIARSQKLRARLVNSKISKYNNYLDKKLELPGYIKGRKIVMVPGQVEDDASIVYGANSMSNDGLLRKVRENVPDAYIIYKPHPDVLAGNRKGHVSDENLKKYVDIVISHVSLDSVLELSDEVHTMTSLVGFEALLRGKKVTTYGIPFYAGWGLTEDKRHCDRRIAVRTLDELVAAAYILYPRYIEPKTNTLCEIEVLLDVLEKEKNKYNKNSLFRMIVNSRNNVLRKVRSMIKAFAEDE